MEEVENKYTDIRNITGLVNEEGNFKLKLHATPNATSELSCIVISSIYIKFSITSNS